MIDVLPEAVRKDIAQHLRRHGDRAHRDWETNSEEEDSLTGAAFAELCTHRSRVTHVDGAAWRWRVAARKFRGRGKNAAEKWTGADGIVELEVWHPLSGVIELKGMLVQAKKNWSGKDARLYKQVVTMEALVPGGSAALDFCRGRYTAIKGSAVMNATGDRAQVSDEEDRSLGGFLADVFVPCQAGLRGLHYDSRRHLLYLPLQEGRPEAVACTISERLRIEIEEIRGA